MVKKPFSFSLLLVVAMLIAFNSHSQDVMVKLYQPPPNQWNVADMWNLMLTNTSSKPIKVFLHGTVETQNDGKIFDGKSAVFELRGNFSGRIEPRTLEPANIKYVDSKYEEIVLRTGTMPEGVYTICVYVMDANSGQELAFDCIDQPIMSISLPSIIYPANEAEITEPMPVFTWAPPSPMTGNYSVSYSLKIVELMDGQVPLEAMESNPAWFTEKSISSTSFQLPISARQLEPGKKYAWQVTAYGNKYEIGQSEVWSFSKTYVEDYVYRVITINENDEPIVSIDSFSYVGDIPDIVVCEIQCPCGGFNIYIIKGNTANDLTEHCITQIHHDTTLRRYYDAANAPSWLQSQWTSQIVGPGAIPRIIKVFSPHEGVYLQADNGDQIQGWAFGLLRTPPWGDIFPTIDGPNSLFCGYCTNPSINSVMSLLKDWLSSNSNPEIEPADFYCPPCNNNNPSPYTSGDWWTEDSASRIKFEWNWDTRNWDYLNICIPAINNYSGISYNPESENILISFEAIKITNPKSDNIITLIKKNDLKKNFKSVEVRNINDGSIMENQSASKYQKSKLSLKNLPKGKYKIVIHFNDNIYLSATISK